MPRQHLETDTFACELVHPVDEVTKIATETIKFPNQQRIVFPQHFQAADQSRPCVQASRCQIFIYVPGLKMSFITRISVKDEMGFSSADVSNQQQ